jgi:hypothetical protein
MEHKKNKTFKRETAWGLLVFWGAMGLTSLWYAQAYQLFEFITLPVFTFAGGAFALDTAVKQGKYGKPDL